MKINIVTNCSICLGVKSIRLVRPNDLGYKYYLAFDNGGKNEICSYIGDSFSVFINNHFYKKYELKSETMLFESLEDLKKYFINHLDQK